VGFREEDEEETAAVVVENLALELAKPRHTVGQCITSSANHQNPSLTKPDYSTANCSGGGGGGLLQPPLSLSARTSERGRGPHACAAACNFQCNNSPLFAAAATPYHPLAGSPKQFRPPILSLLRSRPA